MTKFRLGVIGYSRDLDPEVQAKAEQLLQTGMQELIPKDIDPADVEIVSGFTDSGIPAIAYRIADELGYKTVGFSAAQAKNYTTYPVDIEIIVGEKFGDESDKFLEYIDALLKVGGGKQSAHEFRLFMHRYYPDKSFTAYKLELT